MSESQIHARGTTDVKVPPNANKVIRECFARFCSDGVEFRRFTMDHFKKTDKRITDTMDRLQMENLLLTQQNAEEILEAIKREWPEATLFIQELWKEEPPHTSSNNHGAIWFTEDLGRGLVYRTGPLVITYLSPGARLTVFLGAPWGPQEEIAEIRGSQFRGEFFIEANWSISANSKSCLCSGYYPYSGLPLSDGSHKLKHGAIFYRKFGKQSLIELPIAGSLDLETRKKQAIEETRALLQCIFPDPKWENSNMDDNLSKRLYAYIDII